VPYTRGATAPDRKAELTHEPNHYQTTNLLLLVGPDGAGVVEAVDLADPDGWRRPQHTHHLAAVGLHVSNTFATR
jgi:hypothetical protein